MRFTDWERASISREGSRRVPIESNTGNGKTPKDLEETEELNYNEEGCLEYERK